MARIGHEHRSLIQRLMRAWMIIQGSEKKMDAALTFWMHIRPKHVPGLTRLTFELRSSRCVEDDQCDETKSIFTSRAPSAENTSLAITRLPVELQSFR